MKTNNGKPILKRKSKKSEEGMAILESIPVLFMIVLVFNFSLGFFGAVHSGILNSIASYNYSLETFRFKSNLVYFRPGGGTTNYAGALSRVHGTIQDGSEDSGDNKADDGKWPATMRAITFNFKQGTAGRDLAGALDNESGREYKKNPDKTNIWSVISTSTPSAGETVQTPRIWVKTVYGICLNADCEKK